MAERAPGISAETARSKLHAPTRTSYHNCFFLLKTGVALNGQPAEIGCSEGGELSLSCRCRQGSKSVQLSLSFPSISSRVEDILKNHGGFEVVTFFCEESPLFQVTFSSEHGLKKFVRSRRRVDIELAALFSKMLQPTQQTRAPANPIPSQVSSKLFLMTPDWFGKQCGSIEVTQENCSNCLIVWKDSEVFEFGDFFNKQKSIDIGCIRQAKGTSTSDLRRAQDEATSTSDLRRSQDEATSTSDLRRSQDEATSTSDLRRSQDEATSTSDLRRSQDEATSTSDLMVLQNDGSCNSKPNAQDDSLKLRDKDNEVSVRSVLRWLEEVTEWFLLGTYLTIPQHELKIIKQDHPSNSKECKLTMVDTWIKLGGATWSTLVEALWEIGRRGLANKLADKFGIVLSTVVPDETPASLQYDVLRDISKTDQCLEHTTAALLLAEEDRNKALKDNDQVTRQLKEQISKLAQLEVEKGQLTMQLGEAEDALLALQGLLSKQKKAEDILKQNIASLQDQLGQKNSEIAVVAKDAIDLKAKLQHTTEKLETASNELNKLKTEQDSLKVDLQIKMQELEKEQYKSVFKDDTIQDLKHELTAVRTEANSRTEETGVLKGRLLAKDEEVERLRKALHEAELQKPTKPAVVQQLYHAMQAAELRVKLATEEEGRQEVERQQGALWSQQSQRDSRKPKTDGTPPSPSEEYGRLDTEYQVVSHVAAKPRKNATPSPTSEKYATPDVRPYPSSDVYGSDVYGSDVYGRPVTTDLHKTLTEMDGNPHPPHTAEYGRFVTSRTTEAYQEEPEYADPDTPIWHETEDAYPDTTWSPPEPEDAYPDTNWSPPEPEDAYPDTNWSLPEPEYADSDTWFGHETEDEEPTEF